MLRFTHEVGVQCDYTLRLFIEVLPLMHRLAYILCSSSYQMSTVAVNNKT